MKKINKIFLGFATTQVLKLIKTLTTVISMVFLRHKKKA